MQPEATAFLPQERRVRDAKVPFPPADRKKATAMPQGAVDKAKAAVPSATLTDLRPEDKAKVGNLLRELARAQRDGQQASAERAEYQQKLRTLRSQNTEIVQETVELRTKFRHSLQLLKTYQHTLANRPPPDLSLIHI